MTAATIAGLLAGAVLGDHRCWLGTCPLCGDTKGTQVYESDGHTVVDTCCERENKPRPCPPEEVRDRILALYNERHGEDLPDLLLTPKEHRKRPKTAETAKTAPNGEDRPTGNLITGEQFRAEFKPMKFVIGGMLQPGTLTTLTAPGNAGKTPMLMLMCERIVSGLPVNGRVTKQGNVLYVQGENVVDFRRRYIALHDHSPAFRENEHRHYIYRPTNGPDLVEMMAEVEAFARKTRVEYALIAIDTLAAWATADHDEIDNPAQVAYAKMLHRLNKLPGEPAVVAAAHPAKRPASQLECRPRGGVGFENLTDNNWTLWPKGELVEVAHTRLRVAEWEPFSIRLKEITATSVTDIDDAPVTSVMAELVTEAEQDQAAGKARTNRETIIQAMFPATANAFPTQKAIAVAAGLVLPAVKKTDNGLRVVVKLIGRMLDDKTIEHAQGYYRLSAKTRKWAKETLRAGRLK